MTNKPAFITFTGADSYTNQIRMRAIQSVHPVEWGILFSPSKQGKNNRYPDIYTINTMIKRQLNLAAHICGKYSELIMVGQDPNLPINLKDFNRAQINHGKPNAASIMDFSNRNNHIPCIAQWRNGEHFPERFGTHSWLYDCSGGNGILPEQYPPGPNYMVGYAGGINPDNVLDVLEKIDAKYPFWIDMETGVRDDNDQFDLNKVEQVCRLVYGQSL